MSDLITIEEGKQYLRDNWENGVSCPCCNRNVKLYKRKINSGMSLFLIGLYRLNRKFPREVFFKNKDAMEIMGINTSSLDYSVMKFFDLISDEPTTDSERRNSGLWRITQKGIDFIENKIRVQSHVLLYNNICYGFTNEFVDIRTSLGERFDYSELMGYNRQEML